MFLDRVVRIVLELVFRVLGFLTASFRLFLRFIVCWDIEVHTVGAISIFIVTFFYSLDCISFYIRIYVLYLLTSIVWVVLAFSILRNFFLYFR